MIKNLIQDRFDVETRGVGLVTGENAMPEDVARQRFHVVRDDVFTPRDERVGACDL